MKLGAELIDARVVARVNRFVAEVTVAGCRVAAHVPNSGRLTELLYPGAHVLVAEHTGRRKTRYDLLLAWDGPQLVSVDARLPGPLLAEALSAGALPALGPFARLRREVPLGASRLDLLGEGPDGLCYVEAKSVTLVRERVALFPDAPTARGLRHLAELCRAAAAGHRAAVVFVIQREDARLLRPHAESDPTFAAALQRAAVAVRVLAFACRVTRNEVAIAHPVRVELGRRALVR